jgi:hypothetical protein
MWPFRPRPLDEAKRDWILDHAEWAVAEWGDVLFDRPLITPTRAYFAAPKGENAATAQAVFDDLRRLLHIPPALPIALLPQGSLPDQAAMDHSKITVVSGTYTDDPDHPVITYDPRLLRRPISFISTMAHELMHLILSPHVDAMPGGAETHELATDLHAILFGFGIFQMEDAEQMGWAGYLSQDSRAFALALFLAMRGQEVEAALPHLSPRPAAKLKAAARFLAQTPLPEGLRRPQ